MRKAATYTFRLARLAMLWWLALPLAAQPEPYISVWLDQGQPRAESDRKVLISQIKQHNPQHLVILLHGYDVVRQDGHETYRQVAERVNEFFRQRKQSVSVVGLQWDSAAPGAGVPWQSENAYFKMISRGRGVGHQATRQVLLDLASDFPRTPLHIVSHSLGCEVAAAALYPEMVFPDDAKPTLPPLSPSQKLRVTSWEMLGSDLDYDIWWKSKVDIKQATTRIDMLWMTISSYVGERDRALLWRKMSRGLAGGSALPRMTPAQYDWLFKQRLVFLDDEDLGASHAFLDYVSPARLQRMLGTALHVADPKQTKPAEVAEVDTIRSVPREVGKLRPWLDSPHLSAQTYALWRLEHILCGGSGHFSDETIENVARLMRNTPAKVRQIRVDSVCKTIQRGYWPSEKQLTRAGAPNW